MRSNTQRGFGIVEVLVGASILSLFLISATLALQVFLVQSFNSVEKVKAEFLAEEGVEAVRFIRDRGFDEHFSTLSSGTDYYLFYDDENDHWSATTTEQSPLDDLFQRKFIINDVRRDGNDDITESGGSNDPNTKKVTVTVWWETRNGTSTTSISTYLTNFHE